MLGNAYSVMAVSRIIASSDKNRSVLSEVILSIVWQGQKLGVVYYDNQLVQLPME